MALRLDKFILLPVFQSRISIHKKILDSSVSYYHRTRPKHYRCFDFFWAEFLLVGAPNRAAGGPAFRISLPRDRPEPTKHSPARTNRAQPAQAGPAAPAAIEAHRSPAANPPGNAPEQLTGREGGVGDKQGIAAGVTSATQQTDISSDPQLPVK